MITKAEINPHGYPLDAQQARNFDRLYLVLCRIRAEYGLPMRITSGVRSEADEKRIDPAHPHSQHLQAAAVDIDDKEGRFWNWCVDNLELLTELGVYLESRAYTPTHTHLQIIPPASGHRIFLP